MTQRKEPTFCARVSCIEGLKASYRSVAIARLARLFRSLATSGLFVIKAAARKQMKIDESHIVSIFKYAGFCCIPKPTVLNQHARDLCVRKADEIKRSPALFRSN